MVGLAPGGGTVSAWTFVRFCRGDPYFDVPYGARMRRRAETEIMETAVETRTALEVRDT
jgi:hypothetical protein